MKHNIYIVRGLPGSGKSTLASKMARKWNIPFFEADMWMTNRDGIYEFDNKRLPYCHSQCQQSTESALKCTNVIVSNTFTTVKELEPYLSMDWNIMFVIHMKKDYGSIHNVPDFVIDRMRERWQEIPPVIFKDDLIDVTHDNIVEYTI